MREAAETGFAIQEIFEITQDDDDVMLSAAKHLLFVAAENKADSSLRSE